MLYDEINMLKMSSRVDTTDGEVAGELPEVPQPVLEQAKKVDPYRVKHSSSWIVYGMFEEGSDLIQYVGYTGRTLKARLSAHLTSSRGLKRPVRSYVHNWIKGVLDKGGFIGIREIESGVGLGGVEAEQRWISHYKIINPNLKNISPGGYFYPVAGVYKGKVFREKQSEESLAAKSASMLLAWQRIRDSGKVKSMSDKAKANHASMSEEAKIEWRRKMSLSRIGKTQSPESIAKRKLTRQERGIVTSQETIRSMQAGRDRYFQDKDAVDVWAKANSLRLTAGKIVDPSNWVDASKRYGMSIMCVDNGFTFKSAGSAARAIGVSVPALIRSARCNGYCGGYKWKFV